MARFRSFVDIYTEVLVTICKKTDRSMLELAEEFDKSGIEKMLKEEYDNTLIMKEEHYLKKLGY